MNLASVIAVFESSDAPGNESQVCTCCLFIVFYCGFLCVIFHVLLDNFLLRYWDLELGEGSFYSALVAFEQWRFVFMVHVQYLLWQDFRLQGQIH